MPLLPLTSHESESEVQEGTARFANLGGASEIRRLLEEISSNARTSQDLDFCNMLQSYWLVENALKEIENAPWVQGGRELRTLVAEAWQARTGSCEAMISTYYHEMNKVLDAANQELGITTFEIKVLEGAPKDLGEIETWLTRSRCGFMLALERDIIPTAISKGYTTSPAVGRARLRESVASETSLEKAIRLVGPGSLWVNLSINAV